MATQHPQNSQSTNDSAKTDALRRAALVLISLDDSQAAELLGRMSPREVEAITAAVANLHEIDPEEQAIALNEFRTRLRPHPTIKPVEKAVIENQPPTDYPSLWSPHQIRLAFDPNLAHEWALALADCDQAEVDHVYGSLSRADRKILKIADQNRGPWQLHEPHLARKRIFHCLMSI